MKINEIKKIKENMGEIEYYQYFYFDSSEDFIQDNIKQFREQEKIMMYITEILLQQKQDKYNITFSDGSIMFENKKTKDSYSINIEF